MRDASKLKVLYKTVRVARSRVSTFAEDLGGRSQTGKTAPRKTASVGTQGNPRRTVTTNLGKEKSGNLQHTHCGKPAGNAGNLQETCRKPRSQTGKTAPRQTCDRPGKTAWKPATNKRGDARKPAANCDNQPWEGKVRKPAAHALRETRRKRRKLAGNLQETYGRLGSPFKPKGNPPKNLGKVTREGNLYEAQTNL